MSSDSAVTDFRAKNPGRPRGRPPQGHSPVSEEGLLEVALHAFATQGYQGASLRTIANELGISHNLLSQQYGSKEGLWRAAAHFIFTPFVERLVTAAQSDTGVNGLRAFIEAFTKYTVEYPDLQRLVLSESAIPGPRLDYLCDSFIIPVRDLMTPSFAQLFESGELRPVDVYALYFLITGGSGTMFTGDALTAKLFGPDRIGKTVPDKYAASVADILLNGILIPHP